METKYSPSVFGKKVSAQSVSPHPVFSERCSVYFLLFFFCLSALFFFLSFFFFLFCSFLISFFSPSSLPPAFSSFNNSFMQGAALMLIANQITLAKRNVCVNNACKIPFVFKSNPPQFSRYINPTSLLWEEPS